MMRKKTAALLVLTALMLNGCGVQQNSVAVVAPAAKKKGSSRWSNRRGRSK